MALITCPDCGKQISDVAEQCIGCGRPMRQSGPATPEGEAEPRTVGSMLCDGCGSDQLKKFSLIWEEQRSFNSGKTRIVGAGVGPGGLGVGIGTAGSEGKSITQLARSVAPPDKETMVKNDAVTSLAGVGALVGASGTAYVAYQMAGLWWAIGAFIGVFIFIVILGNSASDVDQRYRRAFAEWERKYLCTKCGATKMQTVEDHRAAAQRSSTDPELDRLIRARMPIQAVKLIQDRTGVGMAEALEMVNRRSDQLGLK